MFKLHALFDVITPVSSLHLYFKHLCWLLICLMLFIWTSCSLRHSWSKNMFNKFKSNLCRLQPLHSHVTDSCQRHGPGLWHQTALPACPSSWPWPTARVGIFLAFNQWVHLLKAGTNRDLPNKLVGSLDSKGNISSISAKKCISRHIEPYPLLATACENPEIIIVDC